MTGVYNPAYFGIPNNIEESIDWPEFDWQKYVRRLDEIAHIIELADNRRMDDKGFCVKSITDVITTEEISHKP